MGVAMLRKWKVWLYRRRRRFTAKQLRKRTAVLQNGMQLYVQVLNVYPTRVSVAQMQLVRLQLHVRLLNNTYMQAVSIAFVSGNPTQLKGQYLRIRFLPGDLSHVVLLI
jgi:hypothetical protein